MCQFYIVQALRRMSLSVIFAFFSEKQKLNTWQSNLKIFPVFHLKNHPLEFQGKLYQFLEKVIWKSFVVWYSMEAWKATVGLQYYFGHTNMCKIVPRYLYKWFRHDSAIQSKYTSGVRVEISPCWHPERDGVTQEAIIWKSYNLTSSAHLVMFKLSLVSCHF